MKTEAALRRAIWDEPYDDEPRLVYSDWLLQTEDSEKVRRGEFIKVQVALARMTEEDPARPALEIRERELLKGRLRAWRAEIPHGLRYRDGRYERGFYKPALAIDLEEFLRWPDRLFQKAPLWNIYGLDGDWDRNQILWPQLGGIKHLWRLDPLQLHFRLGPPDVKIIAKWDVLSRLRGLNLNHNPLGVEGVITLANSDHLGSLERLSLVWCQFGTEGAEALAASTQFRRLIDLNLDQCAIGDSGALAIVSSSNFPRLRRLNLTANNITPDGVIALAANAGLQRIVRLGLNYNQIGDAGAIALAESPHLRHINQLILRFPGHGLELSASPGFNRRSAIELQGADVIHYAQEHTLTERGLRILRDRFQEIHDEPNE
jgi:uncharacterized protein (TIGR02996 family)